MVVTIIKSTSGIFYRPSLATRVTAMTNRPYRLSWVALVITLTLTLLTAAGPVEGIKPGTPLKRTGDEIVVCGQLIHTGTPVVLWTDPGGYDAYRIEKRFGPLDQASWEAISKANPKRTPNRYTTRTKGVSPELAEKVRGGGWTMDELQKVVDQFVIHFDARGTAQKCFEVLHDIRGLSVHFMLDLDGTLYQTLDLKESAWHATISNSRSIGIEIANVGAYGVKAKNPFDLWYAKGADGKTVLTIPDGPEKGGIRNLNVPLRPDRSEPIVGEVQGQNLVQYDLTPQQYETLAKLTATLCTIFPNIKCDYPRDDANQLVTRKLPEADFKAYQGLLGHYHVQSNKVDPGPAFQWDRLIRESRALMTK
jgi:N-acetyl-anhydromuramyl-L-alanine amidase AmpD